MATVILTPQQIGWLQVLVNQKVQSEGTSNSAWSGDSSNNPTFQQSDFTVGQSVLAAIQAAVL